MHMLPAATDQRIDRARRLDQTTGTELAAWFYKHLNGEVGPVSETEIRILLESGQLTPGTKVRTGPDSDWRSIATAFATDMATLAEAAETRIPGSEGWLTDAPRADERREPQHYFYNRGKVAKPLLIGLALAVGLGLAGFRSHSEAAAFAYLAYASAGFFALAVVIWTRRLLQRESALTMDPEGFRLAEFSEDRVPWTAVRDAVRHRSRHADNLIFELDRDVAKTLRLAGLKGLMQRCLGRSRNKATVMIAHMRAEPDVIVREVNAYLARAQVTRPMSPVEQAQAAAEQAMSGRLERDRPLITYLLMVLLSAIYTCEVVFGVDAGDHGAPSIRTLFVFGGTMHDSIFIDHNYWRLFTAPFLHADFLHILFNLVGLWLAGRRLEPLVGRRWFTALFLVSALGGSVASILFNPPNLVGIGASGGIVGLFSALIVASFRFPAGATRTGLQISAARVLIPSLLPLIHAARDGNQIDYASHTGGAIAGAIAMFALLRIWPLEANIPRFPRVASLLGGAYCLILLLALFPILVARQDIVADPFLNFFAGRYTEAASIFTEKSEKGGEPAPYYLLWRYLAQVRGADPQASSNLRNAFAAAPDIWPKPVSKLLLGEASEDATIAAAGNDNQRCEATFYVGEWYLLHGKRDVARDHFAKALAWCPKTYMEFDGAKGELQLMAGIKP